MDASLTYCRAGMGLGENKKEKVQHGEEDND